jgi:two-component system sensor histidine kinase/response regulator
MNKRDVILCIDDEVIVLDSLKEQLQNEYNNYMIEGAESGEEAMEIINELLEDKIELPVVIADYIMPVMKGDKLLEKIHNLIPETKNILLTGQANVEGVSNAVNKANLYRFIEKPWEKEDLILTVKEALRSYNQEKTILKQNVELIELNTNLEKKVELRTKELKELNATKDKFFSIIAHDLKNPFNTLMGFSELLATNINSYKRNKIEEFINIIFQTSKNTFLLLENLLEWARSQTGSLELAPSVVDIYELVDENIDLVYNNATSKKLELINNIPRNAEVFADPNMIHTVIRNLLSNAIKYTKTGGKIEISSKTKNSYIEITVSDSGIGIKPENLKKLFRIDENFTTKGTADETGTGLGLILCKEFVQKNGGEIWVKSTYGKGSEFTIKLRIKKLKNNP